MTKSNFVIFLKHFIKHVKCAKESKVLMLLDNHDSHILNTSLNLAKNNGIVLLTFPPHTSHKLQPLDRTVYGPFKTYYNTSATEWLLTHPGRPISVYDIAELVGKGYPLAFTSSNICNGFKVSGIVPLNENIFSDDEYLCSYVTDRPLEDTEVFTNCAQMSHDVTITTDGLQPTASSSPALMSPQPSTSTDGLQPTASSPAIISPQPSTSVNIVSPDVVRPYPKALPRLNKGGR